MSKSSIAVIVLLSPLICSRSRAVDSIKSASTEKSFFSVYGGLTLPSAGSLSGQWSANHLMGAEIGVFRSDWFMISFDLGHYRFKPLARHWIEPVREDLTSRYTIRYDIIDFFGRRYSFWELYTIKPERVDYDSGGELSYQMIGFNLLATRCLTERMLLFLGPSLEIFHYGNRDMKFRIVKGGTVFTHTINGEEFPTETRTGLGLKTGLNYLLTEKCQIQFRTVFHDLFRNSSIMGFLTVQAGLLLLL